MHAAEVNTVGSWTLLVADAMEDASIEATQLPGRSLAALVLLRNRPGSSVDWLSRRLGFTQSGAVRLVDRMVACSDVAAGEEGGGGPRSASVKSASLRASRTPSLKT